MQRERGHKSKNFCGERPTYEKGRIKRNKLVELKVGSGSIPQVAEG